MRRVVGLIVLLCALGIAGGQEAHAQDGDAPPTRRAGAVANLFETLDPSSPIDGARLELPDGWTVQEAHLLRYGTKPVPVRLRPGSNDTVLLTTAAAIEGPHELVVRVRVGDRPGTRQWHLTPFVSTEDPDAPDSLQQRRFRTVDRLTREVRIEPSARPTGSNRALDLERATGPLLHDVPARLSPGRDRSFSIEFWMQTTGLDQVPFSSWTGEETASYPFEFVVDQSGRLRFYCGRSGRHEALRTNEPVADGDWHHVAVVYDKPDARIRLLLDGTRVDSLRTEALPSVSGALPVAIGGRRPRSSETGTNQRLYTGRLDELRIWPEARSVATLRKRRNRPFAERGPEDAEGPFRLSFNAEADPSQMEWPEGARRAATRLTFQSPLRSLRAHTDGQSVTLRWTAQAAGEGTFVVERSPNGQSFTVVDRLSPLDTEAPSDQPQEIVYTDENVPGNVVFYRVRQVSSTIDTERTTGTIKIGLGADPSSSKAVKLIGNFPNPFKKSTTIAYRVEKTQPITLSVWNLSGKRIATLTDGVHDPSYYEQTLSGDDLPSGTYFVRLETAQGVQSHRMVLLK